MRQTKRKIVVGMILVFPLTLVGCDQATLPPQPATITDDAPAHDAWTKYVTKGGKASIQFPYEPKEQNQQVQHELGTLDFTITMCEAGETAFMISDVTYPVDPSQFDVNTGLEGAVQGAAQNIQGTIVETKDIELSGYPGKATLVRTPENLFARTRIFIDPQGPTLIQTLCVGRRDFVDGEDATFFLDSLTIE